MPLEGYQLRGRLRRADILKGWMASGPGENHGDYALRLLVAAIILLFPAACVLVDRGDSYSLLILMLIGLSVWARNGFRAGLSRREWLYLAGFGAFFLAGVLAFQFGHQTDSGFRLLGRYLRLLLVFPVLMALRRYRPSALVVWSGLGLGALLLGVDAVWERFTAGGFLRPDGDTNVAILFGDLATVTTFAFAAGYVYLDARFPRVGPWLVVACVTSGFFACFLSGTRGAWMALPVLLVLFLLSRHLLRPRAVLLSALALSTLFLALYLVPRTHVRERIVSATSELQNSFKLMHGMGDSATLPKCLQDPDILNAWAGLASISSSDALHLEVVSVPETRLSSLKRNGCDASQVLELKNTSVKNVWITFARTRRSGVAMASAKLLVAGTAIIKFGSYASVQRVKSRDFRIVQMTTPQRVSDSISVLVPGGDIVWLAPIETFVGEYRYGMLHSSISQRLEMWSVAYRLFKSSPLLGVGTGAYQAEALHLVETGEALAVTAEYDHPHSEYLDALSSRGIVGLLALFVLLGIPGWLFYGAIESPDPRRMAAGLAGLLVTVGFAIFGITETMFIHSVTIGWYVIMTAVFMVFAETPDQAAPGVDPGT